LDFSEVKKEIDNDEIVQMDLTNIHATDPVGTGDNVGHAVAIVGYVMPKDGNTATHAPYYEIWNPWWGKTFYVSSKSATISLGGIDYKWTRTWHNWRKTATTGNVSSTIANQKVASVMNPEFESIPINPIFYKLTSEDVSKQKVSEFGKQDSFIDIFTSGITYWYARSLDNNRIMLGVNNAATVGENRQNNGAGKFVSAYQQTVIDSETLVKTGITSISAGLAAVFSLAAAGAESEVAKFIGKFGPVLGINVSILDLIKDISTYKKDISNMNIYFIEACNEAK
jgi:hypothetical protein